MQADEHRFLSQQGVPVSAVWGEKDAIIPLSALGKLAQWSRNARQEVVKDAGHALMQTHPEEVAQAIRGVIRD